MRVPNVSLHVPGLVGLIRNQPVAASPAGVPVPFNDAELVVMEEAAAVDAAGGAASATREVAITTRTGTSERRNEKRDKGSPKVANDLLND